MKILCVKNKGYIPLNVDDSFFRGYIQLDGTNQVLRGNDALNYFASSADFDEFIDRLKNSDGCFCVAVTKGNKHWAAVDRARSMPVFYDSDLAFISDSGELIRKEKNIAADSTNPVRMLEMYLTRYVAHENTVYDQIKQIELGHAIEICDGKIKNVPYFIHTAQRRDITREEAKTLLEQKTDAMIEKLLRVVNGRQIVISLSGGYDSRYLACSLKKYGVDSVACYTYGGGGSFELPDAKRVADALGYKWYYIEYTPKEQKLLFPDFTASYFDYCNEHDFSVYLQNYLAVKKLKESGAIPEDSVMMTGLCNDMPSGAYIPSREQAELYGFSVNGVARYIVDKKFPPDFFMRLHNIELLNQDVHDKLVEEVEANINLLGLIVNDYQTFNGAIDSITTGYLHSKCFLHMNNVHEFFGYEWLLPCWNKDLLKFWYSLPLEMRYKQNLYEEYVTETLGRRFGITHKKVLSLSRNPLKILYRRIKQKTESYIIKFSRLFGVTVIKDINNFEFTKTRLYSFVKQKKASGITFLKTLTTYIMEKRYGSEWYKKISKLFYHR